MSGPKYRIEYTVQRCLPDEEDFVEIGFGSSGSWHGVDAAVVAIESDIQRRSWETEKGQPDPSEVDS